MHRMWCMRTRNDYGWNDAMDIQNLVKMANQIGAFFESMPDREQAKADIAMHLKRFWEPRMRKAIVEGLSTPATEGLSVIVREAIDGCRDGLT